MSPNREMNVPPSQFNMWGGGGEMVVNWVECKNIPINLTPAPLAKKNLSKEWIKIFPVEFRNNFLPSQQLACGRQKNVDDSELQSAPYYCRLSWPSRLPERATVSWGWPLLPERHPSAKDGPAVNLLWLSWDFLFCSSACVSSYYHTSCTMIELLSTVLILAVFELDHFPVHGFLRLSRGQGGAGRLLGWLRHNLPGLRLIANNEI